MAVVHRDDYLVLDTETTGIQQAEIVQIGIVDAQGQVLMDRMVRPLNPIPRAAIAIHGITDSMVADAPTWAETTAEVETLLRDRDLIVYNAVFDRKMMHQSAQQAGLPMTDWKTFSRWWCAMQAFAEVYGQPNRYGRGYRWHKLVNAAQHYHIPVVDAHSALGDARLTLALVKAMAAQYSDPV
jgi:DNA polymerase III epsilon subunit-like protein